MSDRKKNVLILVAEVNVKDYDEGVNENETRSRVTNDRYRNGWEGIFGKGIASKNTNQDKSN